MLSSLELDTYCDRDQHPACPVYPAIQSRGGKIALRDYRSLFSLPAKSDRGQREP